MSRLISVEAPPIEIVIELDVALAAECIASAEEGLTLCRLGCAVTVAVEVLTPVFGGHDLAIGEVSTVSVDAAFCQGVIDGTKRNLFFRC